MSDLGIPTDGETSDSFTTIADVPVTAQSSRVNPNQVATGLGRGTQTWVSPDGSYITIGLIPDGSNQFGIAYWDTKGRLISKNTGVTEYKYDQSTGRNYYQNGLLPDGSYGEAIAKAPYNVSDAITP